MLLNLVKFGEAYDVQDLQYWRLIKKIAERSFPKQDSELELYLQVVFSLHKMELAS